MGNKANDGRRNKRREEIIRKRHIKRRIFSFAAIIAIVILTLHIRDINMQIKDLESALKNIETIYSTNTIAQSQTNSVQAVEDYVSSIDGIEVSKPIKRTADEVIKHLDELGESNDIISQIVKDIDKYPEDILAALANNPEMADFAANYPQRFKAYDNNSKIELTDYEKSISCPLFLQWDPRWGYEAYGDGSCIGMAGCGPTCLSMVLFYLTGNESFTPAKVAKYSMENGYYIEGTGTAWLLMENTMGCKIKVTKPSLSLSSIRAVLDNGGFIICAMRAGDFTTEGHFIVIYGYDKDGFMVNDPNCVARSRKRWTYDELEWQIKSLWAYNRK